MTILQDYFEKKKERKGNVIFFTQCLFFISEWTNEGGATVPLHHVAGFWRPSVPGGVPELPDGGAAFWGPGDQPGPARHPLQRWDRQVRDLLPRRHMPSRGKSNNEEGWT